MAALDTLEFLRRSGRVSWFRSGLGTLLKIKPILTMYDGETSLKRVYHDEDGLRLEPCNDEYDDIHIQPDVFEEVTILGRYVGHVNDQGIFKRNNRRTPSAA